MPFSLKKKPPGQYSTQVFVVKKADNKSDALKDANRLGAPTKTDSRLLAFRGTRLTWRCGNQFRIGRLAVQHMLEKLEGQQLRRRTAVAKPGKRPSRKTAEWELKAAGYAFIRETGPRTNNANQFMEFADRESCRPESYIFGREEGRVERALNKCAKGKANAEGLATWIPTLRDFEPCSSTVGELAPTAVTAKHFAIFKAEPVARVRPAIFDDDELSEQSASTLKAFLNPREEDAAIWARWGSSEFDTGASRQVRNDAYEELFEAELVSKLKESAPKDMGSDDFMRPIRPSLPRAEEDGDLLAAGSRTKCAAVMDKRVYFRRAREEQRRVPWWTYTNPAKPDLLCQKCKEAFGKHRKCPTKPARPASFEDDAKWSMDHLKHLLQHKDAPLVPTVTGAGIFPAAPAPPSGRASLLDSVDRDEQKAACEAIQQVLWQRSAKVSGEQADLMSPPRMRLATGAQKLTGRGGDLGQVDVDE
ncbi:unnamed protein product [Prorocentrum cordatum]|uniref:Uncharacterized protein n=1 Tax=Prorocentrum cordatum TaxID=2364126 RepID=A0ABN9THB1_9DINO|nr:unnamed protein product [Polarella glacialis]